MAIEPYPSAVHFWHTNASSLAAAIYELGISTNSPNRKLNGLADPEPYKSPAAEPLHDRSSQQQQHHHHQTARAAATLARKLERFVEMARKGGAAAAAVVAQFGPSTSSSSSTSSFMVGQGIFFLVFPHIFFGNVTMLIEILRSEGGGRVVVAWELSAKIGRHHVHWPASPR